MARNITFGNDIQLRIALTRDGVAFPIDLATAVRVNLVGLYRRMSLEYQLSEGLVYATAKNVPVGTYGVEIKGSLNK